MGRRRSEREATLGLCEERRSIEVEGWSEVEVASWFGKRLSCGSTKGARCAPPYRTVWSSFEVLNLPRC